MDRELENACIRFGWDVLYERHLPSLGPENARGERDCRSPFPFSADNTASFRVNVRSGLWIDWHAERLTGLRGGNYVQFLALMRAEVDDSGRPANVDFRRAERQLRVELGLSRPVDPAWLAAAQQRLAGSPELAAAWAGHKPWATESLAAVGAGWDDRTQRIVLPLYDSDGQLINCKMYRPGAEPKQVWLQDGMSDNFLFPREARDDAWHVLVEGEPDAVSLRAFGFPGCSGTSGSSSPVPGGMWWAGKDVFVLMDADKSGEQAAMDAARTLVGAARRVVVCSLPRWDGAPSNADVSDWLMGWLAGSAEFDQIQTALRELLLAGTLYASSETALDSEPVAAQFSSALTAVNAGVRLSVKAHTAALSSMKYALPVGITVSCPMRGYAGCKDCPMRNRHNGQLELTVSQRSQIALKLIMTEEEKQRAELLKLAGAPKACPLAIVTATRAVDVRPAMLTSTLEDAEDEFSGSARDRHEALYTGSEPIEDNSDYELTGFVYPMPKTQRQVLLLDSAVRLSSRLDDFELTDELWQRLEKFKPQDLQTPWDALQLVAADMSSSFTLIRSRPDLHMMYRSVWHSLSSFAFAGDVNERGWMEALIVGDTRCGKSKTFRRMRELYGKGVLVDCKSMTQAGLLGAVETSPATGERYVIAGLMPQQDRQGPLFFDEFASQKWDRRGIMDFLSSTRAEGQVHITKAASASFWARVRQMWAANPGAGRHMDDLGFPGVELVTRLISQPEDVARFDAAMAVSQSDVSADEVNELVEPTEPQWLRDDHRTLLAWSWSRKPHQVEWVGDAERAVVECAQWMYERYDSSVPLVEPADQRNRVAKLAVSVAAQVFSTDDGKRLLVTAEHVRAAAELFITWYDKPSFGYDQYSAKTRGERQLADRGAVDELLERVFGHKAIGFAESMLRMHEFTESQVAITIQSSVMQLRPIMQTLSANRCIRPVRGAWKDLYELTPAFVTYLKGFIRERQEAGAAAARNGAH